MGSLSSGNEINDVRCWERRIGDVAGLHFVERSAKRQAQVVLVDRGREQQVEHRFSALWIRELDDSALNLVALIHQEYIPSRKLCSPDDDGISGSADQVQIGLSLEAYGAARKVKIASRCDRDIQLDLVGHPLAGGGFRARLDLPGQRCQVEILRET